MTWWFAFAFAAGAALVFIKLGGQEGSYAGCFILGGVYGAMLYKLMEDRLRRRDLNPRPSGYEPDELTDLLHRAKGR